MSKFLTLNRLVLMGMLVGAALATAVVSGVGQPTLASDCTTGSKYTDFDGSYSGRDTMTVWTKGNKKLCNNVDVNFASFTAPDNYNGKGFKNNPTAIPQTKFYNKVVTLKKGTNGKTTVTVQVPDDCTNYQIDAYIGPVQTKITTSEGLVGTNAIVGKLFQRTKTDCSVPKVKACNTDTGVIEEVEKGQENVAPHTTDLDKCKPKEEEIQVCRLSDKQYPVIIKESEFDDTKYSKDPNDCKTEEETIEVCRLEDKVYPVTIKESEFDSEKYSKDSADCDEEEAPEELPHTGPVATFSGLLGAGALTGSAATYLRSRRSTRK